MKKIIVQVKKVKIVKGKKVKIEIKFERIDYVNQNGLRNRIVICFRIQDTDL